jgi:hypothetical protein
MGFDIEYPIDAPLLIPSGGSISHRCFNGAGSTFESAFVVRAGCY